MIAITSAAEIEPADIQRRARDPKMTIVVGDRNRIDAELEPWSSTGNVKPKAIK